MGNNYVNDFDLLEEVAKMSGTTGKQAYESGTIGDIINTAEKELGSRSRWKSIYDESGRQALVVGKNGRFLSSSGSTGVSTWQGAQQMGTQVVTTSSPKTVEVLSGDVLNAEGQVIKKGLVPGAIKGANFLTAGMAVLGGVATGVQWYKDNPELWTDLGLKLFQWTYADPYDKSWSDILYDALVPTAVDSDGTTYLNANALQALSEGLIDMGFYDVKEVHEANPEYLKEGYVYYKGDAVKEYGDLKFPISTAVPAIPLTYYYSPGVWGIEKITITNNTKPVYITAFVPLPSQFQGVEYKVGSEAPFHILRTSQQSESSDPVTLHNRDATPFQTPNGLLKGYAHSWIPAGSNEQKYCRLPFIYYYPSKDNTSWGSDILTILIFGLDKTAGDVINTELQPDATYPEKGIPLATTFPEWDANRVETVDPNSTPENPVYEKWYPVNIPDTSNGESGSTVPDVKQGESQKGKPDEATKKKIMEWIQDAVSNTVIPWSPNIPSNPDGTVPDKPKPDDPSPEVPVIGGIASSLWQLYNPNITELKAFGGWLWSEDPLDALKRIFSNNPIDGVIGLHQIFMTPITGSRGNIKVGYLDSGIPVNIVSEQYVSIDCGTVYVPPYYNNTLDYGATTIHVYLPFIGIEEISPYDVMGQNVNILYTCDVMTGTILAQITVTSDNYSAVLYTFNGSCGIDYPLTSGSRSSQFLSMVTGAVAGSMSGTSLLGAGLGALGGATRGAEVRRSGSLTSNAGAMGIRKPYLIIKHPVAYDALDYNTLYGYPNNVTDILNKFKGYTRVKDVHPDNINATDEEKRLIEATLKNGIIIS